MKVKLEEGFLSRVLSEARVQRDQRQSPDQGAAMSAHKHIEVSRPRLFVTRCSWDCSLRNVYDFNLLRRIAPTSLSFTLPMQKRRSLRISLLLTCVFATSYVPQGTRMPESHCRRSATSASAGLPQSDTGTVKALTFARGKAGSQNGEATRRE